MMLSMMFSLTLKGLRRSWRQFASVGFVLGIGFLGPLLAASVRTSADLYLRAQARQMLSADLALSALRPFTAEELDEARRVLEPVRVARETEFVTMASGLPMDPNTKREAFVSTLMEVHGVDKEFPLYGTFRVRTASSSSDGSQGDGRQKQNQQDQEQTGEVRSIAELEKNPEAWVFPEVLVQLGLKLGDKIRIGSSEFTVTGEILEGPGALRAGFGLAPRLYIGLRFIDATGLTRYGSQVNHRVYFELPKRADPAIAATLAKSALPDPDIFFRTPDDSIRGLERFSESFARYISVITLIVFALSWMSAFYILQVFLIDRLRDAAILVTLGGGRLLAAGVNALQVLVISLAALGGASVVVGGILALSSRLLAPLLPEGFVLSLHAIDVVAFAGVALASALIFNLPFLMKLMRLRPRVLLGEGSMAVGSDGLGIGSWMISYLPMTALFWPLSAWLMKSWGQGGALLAGLIGTSVGGWLIGRGLFRALYAVIGKRPGRLRLSVTNLARGRFGTNLCFLTLTLASLTLNVVPHLLASFTAEIEPARGRALPELFLFNIPEGSVDELKSFAKENGAELDYLSPMILARLEKVNGKTPEQEFFQKFPVRVSYREKLIPSERIIEGKPIEERFDPESGQDPGVSVEARYAERNGFHLGDRLEFDIQGIPVVGQIANFRRVRWTDFHPNFFMEFQVGVLDDAPKTYLANVNLDDAAKKPTIQFELIRRFPDISVIDIGRTLERITTIVDAMVGPIRQVAWITVAMSFLVLAAVVSHNLRLRAGELDILKILGADANVVRNLIVTEYAFVGLFGSLTGTIAAILISYGVATVIFEIDTHISWSAAAFSGIAIIILTVTIVALAANRAIHRAGFQRSAG